MAGLCNWAEAMCTYHEVAKVVEPKIQALRIAENKLKSATKQKDAAVDELRIVQAKLDAMQVSYHLFISRALGCRLMGARNTSIA